MPENANESEGAFQHLVRVLEEAVQAEADSVELEWEGQDLVAYQYLGHTAVGTAPFPRELQEPILEELVQRAALDRKPRGKMLLTLLGKKSEVLVKQYDSFGESAFILELRKSKKKTTH